MGGHEELAWNLGPFDFNSIKQTLSSESVFIQIIIINKLKDGKKCQNTQTDSFNYLKFVIFP